MYVYIYMCTSIFTYMYICIYRHKYIYKDTVYMNMLYTYMYIRIYAYLDTCKYAYIWDTMRRGAAGRICIHKYIYTCIYMYK